MLFNDKWPCVPVIWNFPAEVNHGVAPILNLEHKTQSFLSIAYFLLREALLILSRNFQFFKLKKKMLNNITLLYYLQLLRIQSPEGVKRIEITQTATLRDLYEAVFKAFGLNDYGFAIFKERNFTKEVILLFIFLCLVYHCFLTAGIESFSNSFSVQSQTWWHALYEVHFRFISSEFLSVLHDYDNDAFL